MEKRKAIHKLVGTMPKMWQYLQTQFKPGHWCFVEPALENTWWNGNSNEL